MRLKRVAYIAVGVLAMTSFFVSSTLGENLFGKSDATIVHQYPTTQYMDLIDSSSNVIVDSASSLAPFIEKLIRIKQGSNEVVSIVHIGDSHVQAGFFTDVLRNNFQNDFGNSGRGLVVPLKLMGSNEPIGYSITSPNKWAGATCTRVKEGQESVGVSAMSISSEEQAVDFTISTNSPFSIIRAFHHPKAPLLQETEGLLIGTICPNENVEGETTIFLNETVSSVTLRGVVEESYNHQTYYGFSLENGEPGVLYHSVGINGAAFGHYNNNPHIIANQVALSPDLIVVSLGTNDSFGNNYTEQEIRRNLERFLDFYAQHLPNVPMLLTTPLEACRSRTARRRKTYTANENIAHTVRVMVEVATERKIPFWDLYTAAGGKGSNKRWYDKGLVSSDRVHLTHEGYGFIGEMLYDAFTRYYNGLAI